MDPDLPIPRILAFEAELAKRPKQIGPRPTWEDSVLETRYGVWVRASGWTWWQRLAHEVLGVRPRMLTSFWGWQRYGA